MPIPNCSLNINPLYNNPFKLVFGRGTDQMEFMIQKANLPGLSIPDFPQPTTLGTTIPIPTLVASFEPLNIEFMVDENLDNWKSLYSWMRNMSNIEDDTYANTQYQNWHYKASLFIYNPLSKVTPTNGCEVVNLEVQFFNIIPISLSGINFQSDSADILIQKATCKFKYSYYKMIPDAPEILYNGPGAQ